MRAVPVIVGYALRESFRRKVFFVVLLLTAAFLALYGWGTRKAFEDVDSFVGGVEEVPVDTVELAGATLFGLSMFATLFLGAVLAIFLTLGVYFAAMAITRWAGGWWPDRILSPGLELAGAVVLIAAVALLGSVFLTSTANGIAVFMVVGAGLVAGLLGQIGEAIGSETLDTVSTYASWALPFEALYQDALSAITADTRGLTRVVVELGPFGGAQESGPLLVVWAFAYLALVGAAAISGFARRDL